MSGLVLLILLCVVITGWISFLGKEPVNETDRAIGIALNDSAVAASLTERWTIKEVNPDAGSTVLRDGKYVTLRTPNVMIETESRIVNVYVDLDTRSVVNIYESLKRVSMLVYSNGSIQKIPYDQLVAHGYADIPDQISPELAPVIANSSFSGNALNVARIALQDPCIRNLINTGGVVLGVDYYIPFHREPAPRLILYVPGQPTERRISAFVNESEGHVSYLMVEYRYEALYDRPGFDPFTTEGWAGGYTCTLDECSDVC